MSSIHNFRYHSSVILRQGFFQRESLNLFQSLCSALFLCFTIRPLQAAHCCSISIFATLNLARLLRSENSLEIFIRFANAPSVHDCETRAQTTDAEFLAGVFPLNFWRRIYRIYKLSRGGWRGGSFLVFWHGSCSFSVSNSIS